MALPASTLSPSPAWDVSIYPWPALGAPNPPSNYGTWFSGGFLYVLGVFGSQGVRLGKYTFGSVGSGSFTEIAVLDAVGAVYYTSTIAIGGVVRIVRTDGSDGEIIDLELATGAQTSYGVLAGLSTNYRGLITDPVTGKHYFFGLVGSLDELKVISGTPSLVTQAINGFGFASISGAFDDDGLLYAGAIAADYSAKQLLFRYKRDFSYEIREALAGSTDPLAGSLNAFLPNAPYAGVALSARNLVIADGYVYFSDSADRVWKCDLDGNILMQITESHQVSLMGWDASTKRFFTARGVSAQSIHVYQ